MILQIWTSPVSGGVSGCGHGAGGCGAWGQVGVVHGGRWVWCVGTGGDVCVDGAYYVVFSGVG